MTAYDLTPEAEEDLKDIIRYTIRQWGTEQGQRYANLLSSGLNRIAENKAVSRTFSQKYPELRVTRCEHHYIFYLPRSPRPLIIAVLYERMDLLSRLQNRLE
jgi:plasmid stabilization system protein ParE